MKKYLRLIHLINLILFMAGIMILYIGFLLFVPLNIMEHKGKMKILPKKVFVPGDQITIQSNLCKHLPYAGNVSVSFVDSIAVKEYEFSANLPVGCRIQSRTFKVPDDLIPDTYIVTYKINYKVSSIRTVTYLFESEPFTVASGSAK